MSDYIYGQREIEFSVTVEFDDEEELLAFVEWMEERS